MAETPEKTGEDPTFVLANLAVVQGLLSQEQLREVLAEQARDAASGRGVPRSLREILLDKKYLTEQQLSQVSDSSATPDRPRAAPQSCGKYQIARELGRGGMGVVYEAMDTQLQRRVALKMMLGNPNADLEEARLDEERFVREAQLSAKLQKHPHLVSVYEAGAIDGKRYLAMEFIEGKPMSKWRKMGSITIRQQVTLLRDVALAVHHAHKQGVIHRDLKPENILVDAENQPHVTDFGLAKSVGQNVSLSLTAAGMVMGTPTHMSPEQAQGLKSLDHRTDIYAMGVMLYETLTGRVPFQGETAIEILMKAVRQPVPSPSSVVKPGTHPTLDKTIENICLKALAKKPQDRYAGGDAFAADLTRWLKGEAVHVAAPLTRRKVVEKKSNNGLIAASAAAAILLIFLGLWIASSRGSSAPPEDALRQKEEQEILTALDRGDRFLRDKNHTEALGAYEGVLSRDPKNARAAAGKHEVQRRMDAQFRAEKDAASEAARKEFEEKALAAAGARKEAEAKAKAERDATLDSERQKLAEERRTFEEKARLAEEARRKAEEQLKAAQAPRPKVPLKCVLPPEEAWKNAVDLLPLMDPSDGNGLGAWTFRDGKLWSDKSLYARIQAAYQPPEEYDFRIVFTRTDGTCDVGQILSHQGSAFWWTMGCANNATYGIGKIGGLWVNQPGNPASGQVAACLENGKLHRSVVQVRKEGVKAYLDGKALAEWSTNFADLSPHEAWGPSDRTLLGIGTFMSVAAFHRVEVLEISGKGRTTRAPGKPAAAKAPVAGSGLIAHWKLDDSGGTKAVDASGRGLDGTLVAAPAWTWGRIGGGLLFDGSRQYVDVPLQDFKSVTNTFSVSLWVRPAAGITPNAHKYALMPTHGGAFYGPDHAGAGLSIGTNGLAVMEHGDQYLPMVIVHEMPIAGWIHVALVYVNRQPKLYVNGKLVKVGSTSPKIVHPSPCIGGDKLGYGPFMGAVDDVRIYDRVLTGPEIASFAKVPGQPLPDSRKQAEAEKIVKEMFKADFARRSTPDQQSLARKLLQIGRETEDNAALRFVILKEARDLATQVGDSPTALAAIDQIGNRFAVDPLEMSMEAITLMSKSAKTPDAWGRVLEDLLSLAGRAADLDQYEVAMNAVVKADVAAKNQQNPSSALRVLARRKEMEEVRKEQTKVKVAEKVLESQPDDPDANLMVGKFACFYKNSWEAGISMLAKGSDAALRTQAEQDLSIPKDSAAQARIGDGWWDLADKQAPIPKASIQGRALEWYKKAWPQLTGDVRNRVRERFLAAQSLKLSASRSGKPAPLGLPQVWSVRGDGIVTDDTLAHSGLRSLKFTKGGGSGVNAGGGPAKPGEQFILSGWFLTCNSTYADNLATHTGDPGKWEMLNLPSDRPWWTYEEKTITAAPGTTGISVAITTWSTGSTIWADDISLRRVGDDKELLENNSFER